MTGLLEHARATPERVAYAIGSCGFRETYGQLERRSRRVAHWLRSLGLRRGDSVAVLLGNIEQFFDIYWGTQRIGLFLTPINWHLGTAEVEYIVENCAAGLLIASADSANTAAATATALGDRVAHRFSVGGEIPGFAALEQAVSRVAEDKPLPDQCPGSVMLYSSGTTGQPKGIRRPLHNCEFDDEALVQAQTRFVRLFGFRPGDRYLCPAPLYHAAPMRSCAAMHCLGGTVHVMDRFDAEEALRIIAEQRIQVSQWVPTHFKRLLTLPAGVRKRYDVSSLRVAVHAAAPCPVPLKRAMIDWWGEILTEYYAGTEGGGTMIDSGQWLAHPGSVGRAWPDVDLAIFDQSLQRVSTPGEQGTVYFRDTMAAKFVYHGDEKKTAGAYHGDWFTLGDIGYLDGEGYLYLTDRQSNMIISGGVNIYPQETENCLLSHPKVLDVAVFGVPCEEMGEAVHACAIAAPGIDADHGLQGELIDWCRGQIAHYKAPRAIDFVDELPRTETGKLLKRKLQERYGKVFSSTDSATPEHYPRATRETR